MAYHPPRVSKWFEKDWQFAVAMSKLPLLRPASIAIGFMPLFSKASTVFFGLPVVEIPLSAWITWWSSVAFIASWTVIQIKCPFLIRHYRNYGDFAAEQHSHRWLVWLFYLKLPSHEGWEKVVRETIAKGLSVSTRDSWPAELRRVCPYLVRTPGTDEKQVFAEPTTKNEVRLYYPENIERDLYIPFICDGDRWTLSLQERDPELDAKAKELFWLHYTAVTKTSPGWRFAFWVLFYISVGLLALNVLWNVKLALVG